jgi:UDP-3-O-[3-hydroxymyristoyl] glucosamine N-acyltransferase
VATQNVKVLADHIEYDLHYYPESNRRQEWEPAVIDIDFEDVGVPMPHQICSESRYSIPLTEKAIIQIDHWVNLWAANIASLLQRESNWLKMPKIKAAVLALKARSLNKWKILSRLNTISSRCDIHPTAYIEGSIIGENATIGAGAVVRGSLIGDGVFMDNGVIVEQSVIGEGSTILDGRIMYSVLYPGVSASTHRIITSLIGRDVLIGADVTLTNFRFDGKNIMVMKNGERIDTGNKFVGSCLGHRAYLGAGCIVAPGRAIPSDTRIARDKGGVITSCDPAKEIPGYRFVTEQRTEAP